MRHRIPLATVVVLVITSIVAFGQAQPTTRESEDLLKVRGLTKAGSLYLLDADMRLDEGVAVARRRRAHDEPSPAHGD